MWGRYGDMQLRVYLFPVLSMWMIPSEGVKQPSESSSLTATDTLATYCLLLSQKRIRA